MTKLVVWDWNGTLFADTAACYEADNHVIKSYGGNAISIGTFRDTIAIPAIDFYIQHGCNREELLATPERLAGLFHTFYENRSKNCRLRKGARSVLKCIRDDFHAESVILSNHTVDGINFQLSRVGIEDYFCGLLANDDKNASMKGRNKREKLNDYMEAKKYEPKDVAIVGDTTEEIEIGKFFGIKTIAITDGYYAAWRLRESKPNYLITCLEQVPEILEAVA